MVFRRYCGARILGANVRGDTRLFGDASERVVHFPRDLGACDRRRSSDDRDKGAGKRAAGATLLRDFTTLFWPRARLCRDRRVLNAWLRGVLERLWRLVPRRARTVDARLFILRVRLENARRMLFNGVSRARLGDDVGE